MCQISAKPVTTAKKALTMPLGLFFGASIGSYSGVGVGWFEPGSTLRFARQ